MEHIKDDGNKTRRERERTMALCSSWTVMHVDFWWIKCSDVLPRKGSTAGVAPRHQKRCSTCIATAVDTESSMCPTVIPTKTFQSKFLRDKTQHIWKQSWHWIYGPEQSNAETRAIRRSIAGPMFAEELWQCSIEQHFSWSKRNPCWNLVLLKCRWDRPTYWWDRVQTAQWPDCKDAFFLRRDDLRIQDESESRGISNNIFQNQRPGKQKIIKMLHPRGKTHRFWGCDCGSTYLCRGDSGVG